MIKDETVETAFFANRCGNDTFRDGRGRRISGDIGCLAGVCRLKFLERADGAGGEEDVAGESGREEVCSDCVAYACGERPNC